MAALLPTIRPACGPPSSLSPLKVTTSQPAASFSCGSGLARQAPLRQVDQRAAAQVGGQRQAARVGDGGEIGFVHRGVKPCTA
jgi:hypothetical protein